MSISASRVDILITLRRRYLATAVEKLAKSEKSYLEIGKRLTSVQGSIVSIQSQMNVGIGKGSSSARDLDLAIRYTDEQRSRLNRLKSKEQVVLKERDEANSRLEQMQDMVADAKRALSKVLEEGKR